MNSQQKTADAHCQDVVSTYTLGYGAYALNKTHGISTGFTNNYNK